MTALLIALLLLRCKRRVPVAPSVPSLRSSQDGVAHCFASLALHTACACGAVGPFASPVAWQCRSLLRFSLFNRRVPVAPSGPSLRSSHDESLIALLLKLCNRRLPVAPSVPSLRSSHDGVAHCFAFLALQTACASGAVGTFASLVTTRRRSLLRFSCVAYRIPVAPSDTSLRSSHDGNAHCFASLALHTACACGAVCPLLRSSHGGVARCFACLALQTACACGAVGPFASLVTRRRRSSLRFSCVANGVCLGRRRSLRFARHMAESLIASRFSCVANGVCLWLRQSLRFARRMTALLITSLLLRCKRRVPGAPSVPSRRSSHGGVAHCFSLLLRCKRRVPVAPSVPSLRSSNDGVAHCFASLALQTACACGAVGPFASLVT